MSGTSLSRELALLAGTFGYDLDDLAAFQINAALGSFLPLEDREEIIATITAGHQEASDVPCRRCRTTPSCSERARPRGATRSGSPVPRSSPRGRRRRRTPTR